MLGAKHVSNLELKGFNPILFMIGLHRYLQFSFRWMNCLLMREVPLRCAIRLWDTYHAEQDGFAQFHL